MRLAVVCLYTIPTYRCQWQCVCVWVCVQRDCIVSAHEPSAADASHRFGPQLYLLELSDKVFFSFFFKWYFICDERRRQIGCCRQAEHSFHSPIVILLYSFSLFNQVRAGHVCVCRSFLPRLRIIEKKNAVSTVSKLALIVERRWRWRWRRRRHRNKKKSSNKNMFSSVEFYRKL